MVYFTFVVDTVSTIFTYTCVYLYTITHWGDVSYLQKQYWQGTAVIATTALTETIVQCFLIYRFWKMTQNIYVTSVLNLLMLASLAGSLATVINLVMYTEFAQRDKLVLSATIWSGTNVASNVAIALALLWQLRRIKSPFKATRGLIHKLMASTISTGTLTSVFSVVGVILFVCNNSSNAATAFSFCEGRVFALTMLYNLNNRRSLNRGSVNTSDARCADSSNTINVMKEICVHCTTDIHQESSNNHDPLKLSNCSKDQSDALSTQGKV